VRSVAQEFSSNKDFRARARKKPRRCNSIRDERGGSLHASEIHHCLAGTVVLRLEQRRVSPVPSWDRSGEELKKIRGTGGKADPSDVLLDDFCVLMQSLRLAVQQRTATIARIDERVRLDPRSRTGIGNFPTALTMPFVS